MYLEKIITPYFNLVNTNWCFSVTVYTEVFTLGKYERIRNLREDRDLTQKQVADILFMQLTQYRRYESGERELPLDIAITLSKFYNVPIDYIAGTSNKITISEEGLTTNEKQLLHNYRNLSETDKVKLLKISSIME